MDISPGDAQSLLLTENHFPEKITTSQFIAPCKHTSAES